MIEDSEKPCWCSPPFFLCPPPKFTLSLYTRRAGDQRARNVLYPRVAAGAVQIQPRQRIGRIRRHVERGGVQHEAAIRLREGVKVGEIDENKEQGRMMEGSTSPD